MESNNWLEFARQDLEMAEVAFDRKIYNQTCFHCQQAVEKFLKGYLTRYPDALPGMLPEGLPEEKDAREAISFAREMMSFVMKKL